MMTNIHKKLERAERAAERLNLSQLRELDSWIHELLESLEAAQNQPIPVKTGAEVIEERREGAITYRLQRVKCGKPSCKCVSGAGHGPYWYGFQWRNGRTVSQYIGKTLKGS